mmetsp:Transcript_20495/g.44821  ORF Transcript_20495/g.44821 Transcript_20495/m.44821 type:complete len:206 (-) Transcript_20495:74-691(-)
MAAVSTGGPSAGNAPTSLAAVTSGRGSSGRPMRSSCSSSAAISLISATGMPTSCACAASASSSSDWMGLPIDQRVFWISLKSPASSTAATRKVSSPRAMKRLGCVPSAEVSFAAGFAAGRFTGFPATLSRPARFLDASSVSTTEVARVSAPWCAAAAAAAGNVGAVYPPGIPDPIGIIPAPPEGPINPEGGGALELEPRPARNPS